MIWWMIVGFYAGLFVGLGTWTALDSLGILAGIGVFFFFVIAGTGSGKKQGGH